MKPAKKRVNNVELNVDEENTKKDEPENARKSGIGARSSVPKRKKYYYDSLPEEEKKQHDKLVLHNNKILKDISELKKLKQDSLVYLRKSSISKKALVRKNI